MATDELADALAVELGRPVAASRSEHLAAWLRGEGRAVVARALGLVDFLEMVKRDGELWKLGFEEGQRVPYTCPRCERTWPTAYCKFCEKFTAVRTGDGDEHRGD